MATTHLPSQGACGRRALPWPLESLPTSPLPSDMQTLRGTLASLSLQHEERGTHVGKRDASTARTTSHEGARPRRSCDPQFVANGQPKQQINCEEHPRCPTECATLPLQRP